MWGMTLTLAGRVEGRGAVTIHSQEIWGVPHTIRADKAPVSVLCVSATPGLFRILTTTQLSDSKCPCLLCPAFAQWTWLSVFLALDAEETALNKTGQFCPGGACTFAGGPRHTWSMSGAISPQREGKGGCPSCVGEGGTAILKTGLRESLAFGILIKLLSMLDIVLTTVQVIPNKRL